MKNIITAVWCRRLDCRFCNKRHTEDIHGRFSSCGKEEITIDQNGRCEYYEHEITEEEEAEIREAEAATEMEEIEEAEFRREMANYEREVEWDGEHL